MSRIGGMHQLALDWTFNQNEEQSKRKREKYPAILHYT